MQAINTPANIGIKTPIKTEIEPISFTQPLISDDTGKSIAVIQTIPQIIFSE